MRWSPRSTHALTVALIVASACASPRRADDDAPCAALDVRVAGRRVCILVDAQWWCSERGSDEFEKAVDVAGRARAVAFGQTETCSCIDGVASCRRHAQHAVPGPCRDVDVNELGDLCVLTVAGMAVCSPGDLGASPEEPLAALALSSVHACGLLARGGVRCWGGRNFFGELGEVNSVESVLLRDVGNLREVAVATGSSCALTESGDVWCWGRDYGTDCGVSDHLSPASYRALGAGACAVAEPQRLLEVSAAHRLRVGDGRVCVQQYRDMLCARARLASAASSSTSGVVRYRDVATFDVGERSGCLIDRSAGLHCWGAAVGVREPTDPGSLIELPRELREEVARCVRSIPPRQ